MRARGYVATAIAIASCAAACFDFGDLSNGSASDGNGDGAIDDRALDDEPTGAEPPDAAGNDAACSDLFEGVCNGSEVVQAVLGPKGILGERVACVLLRSGHVWCWGPNGYGQLAATPVTGGGSFPPSEIAGLDHVIQIGAGAQYVCALRDDTYQRSLWCWGANIVGELGHSNDNDQVCQLGVHCNITPTRVGALGFIQQIAIGGFFACALTSANDLYCWGSDYTGELGPIGDGGNYFEPQIVYHFTSPPTIAAGTDFACLLNAGVDCWGANGGGQLGHLPGSNGDGTGPNFTNRYEQQVKTEAGVPVLASSISLDGARGCAADGDGGVYCWGLVYPQLHPSDPPPDASLPITVVREGATQVTTGAGHICTRAPNGDIACWGQNDWGKLGAVDGSALPPGAVVFNGTDVVAGDDTTLAIAADGSVWGWGYLDMLDAGAGQPTGNGSTTPVRIPGLP